MIDFISNGRFMPAYINDFVKGMYADVGTMFSGVRSYLNRAGMDTSLLANVETNLKQYLRSQEQVERINQEWQTIKTNNDPNFISSG